MPTFLPIAILAYALNGGSLIIDKILIRKLLPNPLVYTFYVAVLQFLVIFLIPLGFNLQFNNGFYFAIFSGITSIAALYALYTSLKLNEASIVGPVVGSLNPVFTAIIGALLLNQLLNQNQYVAILILILGALFLAFNQTFLKIDLGKKFWWMVISGLFFAISYIFLRQAFLQDSFVNVLVNSRLAAAILGLLFLIPNSTRKAIFYKQKSDSTRSKNVAIFLGLGQIMGVGQGLLLTYATSLANPALVNSLFGVQYLIILLVALFLYQKFPNLLDEKLTAKVIIQKLFGVIILSFGLYLIAK